MTEREELLADLSKLDDQAYFGDEAHSAGDALASKALDSSFRGLLLGAPRIVNTDTQRSLPAVLISARTAVRSETLPLHDNAIVAGVDLDSGAVMLSEAFPGDPSKSPEDQPQAAPHSPAGSADQRGPDGGTARLDEPGDGDSAGTAMLEFRSLLHLPWVRSRLALWVIYFDQVSNPALVALESKEETARTGWSAQAASALVERVRAAEQGKHGYPRFVRSAETPALTATGVSLALGTNAWKMGSGSLPVHGILRLQISPQMIVQISQGAADIGTAGAQRLPSAVVRGMLLVAMKNRNLPIRVPLEIPVWTDQPARAGDVVEAVFALDLAEALPRQPIPGKYQVYLLAGPYLSGPHALTLSPGQ